MTRINSLIFFLTLATISTPAFALAVPGPEAGLGLGSMALFGAAYILLRKFTQK